MSENPEVKRSLALARELKDLLTKYGVTDLYGNNQKARIALEGGETFDVTHTGLRGDSNPVMVITFSKSINV